jgi:hypothetical protein
MVKAPDKKKPQRSRPRWSWGALRLRSRKALWLRKALRLLGRGLFHLVMLPIRALLLSWVLTTRFFLVVATLVLVLYFVATTVVTGPLVLGIVNDTLLGTFQADHVEVSLVTAKVQLFNVRITHPMGHDIIHARRVATGIDAAGLIFWGAKSAIGVAGRMPLLLRETRIDDYDVLLPFDGDGMHFAEAFLPKVVSTDEEPPGPGPIVTLSHVVLGSGTATLDFGEWSMPISVERVNADMRIGGPEEFLLTARMVQVSDFRIVGLLPPPVGFVTEVGSAVNIARFRMNLKDMEAHGATIVHPDFKASVSDFKFEFSLDSLPATGHGKISLLSPYRLEEVSMGHVFGTAAVDFEMFGSLSLPEFRFGVRAPSLVVEGLPFENVVAEANLDLHGGVVVQVSDLEANLMGGDISLSQADFELEYGGDPELGVDGCFEGIRPALVAAGLEVEGLEDYSDLVASGCCHRCRLNVGSDGLRMDGGVAVSVDTGVVATLQSGVSGGLIEAFVSWAGDAVRWEGLALTTDIGHISSVGFLTLGADLKGRVDAALFMEEIADVPYLGALGIGGGIEVPDIVVSGSMADPSIHITAAGERLRFAGETFAHVAFGGGFVGGRAHLDSFCFQHHLSHGCLAATVSLPIDGSELLPMPLTFTVAEPIALDLGNLPFVTLPVTGDLTLGPVDVQGSVHSDWLDTLASFEGAVRLAGKDLASQEFDLRAEALQFEVDKAMAPAGPPDPGASRIELSVHRFSGRDIKLQRGALLLDLETVAGLGTETVGFPIPIGEGSATASGLEVGGEKVDEINLALTGTQEPLGGTAQGRIKLSEGAELEVSVVVDAETLRARLSAATQSFPLVALPAAVLDDELRELLAETRVTTRVEASKLDLPALLDGDWVALIDGLQASGAVTVRNLESLPEPITEAEAKFSLRRGRLSLDPLLVTLLGGTEVSFVGKVWPLRSRLRGTLHLPRIQLTALRNYRQLDIPVNAGIEATVDLDGPWLAPEVQATIGISDLVAAEITLGGAQLMISGEVGKQLQIVAKEFLPHVTLESAVLSFDGGLPDRLDAVLSFASLTPAQILTDFPEVVSAKATGTAVMAVRFQDGEAFTAAVDLPVNKLEACLNSDALSICMKNPTPSKIIVDTSGVRFEATHLVGGGHTLDVRGGLDYRAGWDLSVGASLDVARVPFLGEWLASYEGRVGTGKEPLLISGPLDNPEIRGSIQLANIDLMPRQLGSEIAIPHGVFQVGGSLLEGRMVGLIEEDVPLAGSYDEGTFSVYGWFRLREWLPDDALLNLSGKEIYYQSPGQFRLIVSPRVEFSARGMSGEDGGQTSLSGDVFLSEGEFTRNFDRLIGSFATAFSRTQERYSKPITETLPFLSNMTMDLRVRGGNFAVSSRFPFGETELAVNLDLRVGGTLDDIKLYDWMRLVPGGTITYKVVKRVFSITQGTVDFSGPPGTPYIDIEAVTEVPYKRSSDAGVALELDEEAWGENVPIKIRLTGTYPNITPEFSSDKPGFDDADLQTLLLLGMTRKDLEGRSDESGGRADVSINLLTEDVAGMVSNLLLAPFVDTVSLGFTTTGGIMAEAATKIGRAISLSTRVRKDSEEEEYVAGIRFKITDRLSLEGRMKKAEDQFDSQTLYEAKFKYVIPLD